MFHVGLHLRLSLKSCVKSVLCADSFMTNKTKPKPQGTGKEKTNLKNLERHNHQLGVFHFLERMSHKQLRL